MKHLKKRLKTLIYLFFSILITCIYFDIFVCLHHIEINDDVNFHQLIHEHIHGNKAIK